MNNENNKIAFILNLIGLCNCIFSCFISIIILIRIIFNLCCHNMKQENRITMILCTYIYLFILIYVILLGSMNINTLLGDLYQYNFYSSWCIFRAYFITVVLNTLYCIYVNQAFFRLCHTVYSTCRWLQCFWLYVVIPPIELIFAFALLYPLLFWNDIVYLSKEHYCYVSFRNFRGIIWIMFNAYGIPLLCLMFIYFRITVFVHRQSNNQTFRIKRRQKRDLFIIRRILMNISLLLILGLPSLILLLRLIVTGEEHPLIFRISLISASVSMAGLSVSTVLFTPKLKSIFFKKLQPNQM